MKPYRRLTHRISTGLWASGLSLGLGMLASLVAPKMAFADEPAAAPTPVGDPAPTPPDEPAPAATADPGPPKQTVSPRPLPESVLAMQGHDVVLRLEDGEQVEGHLISASQEGFDVRKANGQMIRIYRRRVRGIRLAGTVEPKPARDPEIPPDMHPTLSDPVQGPQRNVGLGTAFGGGGSAAVVTTSGSSRSKSAVAPYLLLPTLELQLFLPREYSIDLSIPVLNMALTSALAKGAFVTADLFANVNAGQGRIRFVGGPGIGFAYLSTQGDSATSVRIPMQIGFEALSKKRTFGFKMLARPWLELASGSRANALGGGFLAAVVFSGYSVSGPGE